jgi:hypothetical protein
MIDELTERRKRKWEERWGRVQAARPEIEQALYTALQDFWNNNIAFHKLPSERFAITSEAQRQLNTVCMMGYYLFRVAEKNGMQHEDIAKAVSWVIYDEAYAVGNYDAIKPLLEEDDGDPTAGAEGDGKE